MRFLLVPALCLATLVLLVLGREEPSLYDPSRRPEYQESLEALLTRSCATNNKKCNIWAVLAADVCSFPTRDIKCQSDCKFLLELILDNVESPPLVSQLKNYVPDDCVPEKRPSQANLQSSPVSESEDQQDTCDDEEDEKPAFHSYHFGFETDQNELEHVFLRSVSVDPTRNTPFCTAGLPKGAQRGQPGDVWALLCRDRFGKSFLGDIYYLCTYSGTIMTYTGKCHFAPDHEEEEMNAVSTRVRRGASTDIDVKKAFENGATLLKGLSDFLLKDKVQDFLPIAAKLASVLGPIGFAFQFVAFFLPASDPKFDAIMGQFKEMTMKFAEISNQISHLEDVFNKLLWEGEMIVPVQNLIYLETTIEDYSNQKTDPYLERVQAACKVFPGDKFITDMLHVMGTKSSDQIAKIYEYNRNQFSDQFAKAMLVYSVRGASAAVHCMGLHQNATIADTNYLAKSLQNLTSSLNQIVQDLYYDFIPNRAMNNYISVDVDNFMAKYHSSSNDVIASDLHKKLTKAYDWYHGFGVAVYQNVDSNTGASQTKCNRCVGQTNSGSYIVASSAFGKTVYLTYGVTSTPDMEQYVIDVYKYANRESVQPVADYFVNKGTKYPIRNSLVVRFGNGLRASLSSSARFYNVQSTSIMVSY